MANLTRAEVKTFNWLRLSRFDSEVFKWGEDVERVASLDHEQFEEFSYHPGPFLQRQVDDWIELATPYESRSMY